MLTRRKKNLTRTLRLSYSEADRLRQKLYSDVDRLSLSDVKKLITVLDDVYPEITKRTQQWPWRLALTCFGAGMGLVVLVLLIV
jgi:hypothetical protein